VVGPIDTSPLTLPVWMLKNDFVGRNARKYSVVDEEFESRLKLRTKELGGAFPALPAEPPPRTFAES